MKFARNVSNRVFYMNQGGIYEDGSTEQVFDHPKRELTRAFIQKLHLFRHVVPAVHYDFLDFEARLENYAARTS